MSSNKEFVDKYVYNTDTLKSLIYDMLNFMKHAPASYATGVVANGVDEGDVLAGKMIEEFENRARQIGLYNE